MFSYIAGINVDETDKKYVIMIKYFSKMSGAIQVYTIFPMTFWEMRCSKTQAIFRPISVTLTAKGIIFLRNFMFPF